MELRNFRNRNGETFIMMLRKFEEFDLILQLLKFFKNKNLDLDFLIGKNSSISEEQNLIEKFMEDYEIYQKTKSNFNQKNSEKIYEILEFIYLNKDFYFLENLNFSKNYLNELENKLSFLYKKPLIKKFSLFIANEIKTIKENNENENEGNLSNNFLMELNNFDLNENLNFFLWDFYLLFNFYFEKNKIISFENIFNNLNLILTKKNKFILFFNKQNLSEQESKEKYYNYIENFNIFELFLKSNNFQISETENQKNLNLLENCTKLIFNLLEIQNDKIFLKNFCEIYFIYRKKNFPTLINLLGNCKHFSTKLKFEIFKKFFEIYINCL